MTPEEAKDAQRLSRVVRSARKLLGMTQADLARELDIQQGTLSKIESGRLILSSTQWFRFCQWVRVDPRETYATGLIDIWSPVSSVYETSGTELLPAQYRFSAESRVRSLRPWIIWVSAKMGDRKFDEFCKARRVDPDCFVALPTKVSLSFLFDLIGEGLERQTLTKKEISEIAVGAMSPVIHGPQWSEYLEAKEASRGLKRLVQNSARYETNFDYRVEESSPRKWVLSALPRAHTIELIQKSPHQDRLGAVLDLYRGYYFENFLKSTYQTECSVVTRESVFRGDERCLYEISIKTA